MSSFAIPTTGRKLSKRKRVLEDEGKEEQVLAPDDQPTSRDASGKNSMPFIR